jgi:hypothetical protein
LADLEHALDVANKVAFGGAPSGVKTEALATYNRIQNKLDALGAHILTPFEATQEHRAEGHASPIEWQKHHCRAKGPDASRRRRLARRLKGLPVTERALTRGEITVEHVEVLARAQQLVGEDLFALLEEPLVDTAGRKRFCDFVHTVEYAVMRAKPRDAEDRASQALEDRYASSSRTFGGVGKVDAGLDPVGFALWQAELERLCQHLLEQDRAEARDRLGRPPLASELRRSARQRRADALVLMAERSAAFDGELGPSSFSVVAHADAVLLASIVAVLRQALNAAEDEDFDLDAALDGIELTSDSLHELDDGTVITINTIVLALLAGTVRGILFDPHGEILRFGHARRLFTPAQAAALRAKYRRCCHPYGCDRTAPFLQADHIREHQHGGPTDTTNGQPLDGGHNTWKTNHPGDQPHHPDRAQRRRPPQPGPPPPTHEPPAVDPRGPVPAARGSEHRPRR